MATRADAWRARQKQMAERSPTIRIDRCTIEPLQGDKGQEADKGYLVVIEGFRLHQAISPPRITVGKLVVESVTFRADGKQIRGVLRARPDDDRVRVDYGFAHAESRALRTGDAG
jgi:hypothetical protein